MRTLSGGFCLSPDDTEGYLRRVPGTRVCGESLFIDHRTTKEEVACLIKTIGGIGRGIT